MKSGWQRFWAIVLVGTGVAAFSGCGGSSDNLGEATRLRLVLDYLPNPLHTGIYYARATDLYAENDVALEITAPTATTDTLRLVAAGRADVGLVPLMDFLQAVERGQDFRLLMPLVDRPLAAVMVRKATGVTRPRDLEGRLVGLTGVPSDRLTLEAMVRNDGGDPERVETIVIGFNAAQNLVAKTVDAAFGFWSYEGVLAGRSVELEYFYPQDYGIPKYPEIVAFVREEFLENNEGAVDAFRDATVRGYAAALAAEPRRALAPLAQVLEGETADDLEPFWEVLHPVVPGSGDFRGEFDVQSLQDYLDWVVAQGFLSGSRPVESLLMESVAAE